jgi:hypothetical protein
MPPSPAPDPDAGSAEVERFRPGGVAHAVASGLLEAALALVLLGLAQLAGDADPGVAATLVAAAVLWLVLGAYSLAVGTLRARVWEVWLDADGVAVRGLFGTRRWRYDELSAVEVGGGRARLVARDGRTRRVRGVRGAEQGRRFRARVLARATEAAGTGPGVAPDAGAGPDGTPDTAGAGRLPAGGPDGEGGSGSTAAST